MAGGRPTTVQGRRAARSNALSNIHTAHGSNRKGTTPRVDFVIHPVDLPTSAVPVPPPAAGAASGFQPEVK